ncbi:MAG TPA: tyrosine-protein phosphatase [Phototrophicaceae bacterium]|nr:tyrosine-protein phosphatase [Phototrophicaceae bacterium]
MAEANRLIEVEGGYNARDLGGYPTADGHVTRWHTFVRAGTLDKLTARGQQQLANYGVRTVIDLRDEDEAHDFPDLYVPSTAYHNLPFFGRELSSEATWQKMWTVVPTLHELYYHYFDRCQPQVKAIIATIAASEPGILFHCYAGKDRTGLIAAILLSTAGVPEDIIAQDYEQTSQHIHHLVVQWHEDARKNGGSLDIVERDSGAAADEMLDALEYVRQRYGGIASYLRLIGITDTQSIRLKSMLVE